MSVVAVVRDISHHNVVGNYDALRANADAFQIKVTEGTSFEDNLASTHYRGCGGRPRAPYHFSRPVSIPDQIAHFLKRKRSIGTWERIDMLDCEFAGITAAFIRAIVAEYRQQSGVSAVQVYLGFHEITTSCPPSQWWDAGIAMHIARYRKIGEPSDTSKWKNHLGYDHPGLTTYQWDNAWPFYAGGPTGDISYDRTDISRFAKPAVDSDGELRRIRQQLISNA